MAVTTLEDFYTLVSNNIVSIQYNRGSGVEPLGVQCTLVSDHIPVNDVNTLALAHIANIYSQYTGTDSDQTIFNEWVVKSDSRYTLPEYLKVYSTNFDNWINLKITDILSVSIVGS